MWVKKIDLYARQIREPINFEFLLLIFQMDHHACRSMIGNLQLMLNVGLYFFALVHTHLYTCIQQNEAAKAIVYNWIYKY